jgi:lipopolysaccharide transport system permease protein
MSEPTESNRTIIIEPYSGWKSLNFREVWQARELLGFMAWRDIKVRYKQTILGAVWAILQPALMIFIFTIIFNKLAKVDTGEIPYPLFVCCGLLPWSYFSTAMGNAANSVVGSERLITKIYFPRLVVPYSAVFASTVDFFIALSLMFAVMVWFQFPPGWTILMLPGIILLIALLALGVGTGLSALNVSYRDFRHILPFAIQLAMFATPSIFMSTKIASDSWLQWLILLNPMNTLIASFRAAVLGTPIPWIALGWTSLVVLVVFVFGSVYFRKVEDRFADII